MEIGIVLKLVKSYKKKIRDKKVINNLKMKEMRKNIVRRKLENMKNQIDREKKIRKETNQKKLKNQQRF